MAEENKIQLYREGVVSRIRKLSAAVGESNSPGPDGEIDFHYLLRVLRDRYRVILAVTAATVLLALVVSLMMKPTYRSQATIEIKAATPDIQSLTQLESAHAAPDNVVETEIETEIGILKSDRLVKRVIDQLLLTRQSKPGFSISGIVSNGWRAFVHWYTGSSAEASDDAGSSSTDLAESGTTDSVSPSNRSPESETDAKAYEGLVRRFEASLAVSRIGSSRLVSVSYESDDPRLCSRVVNAIIANYLQVHEKATEKLTKLLAQEVQEAKQDLEKSEAKTSQYARGNDLLYLETDKVPSPQ